MSIKQPSQFDAVVAAVAAGQTIAAAAKLVGINPRTAYRWSRETSFKKRIKEAQAEAVIEAMAILTSGMTSTATRLLQLTQSSNEKVALSACLGLLDKVVKLHEQFDLQLQINELKAIVLPAEHPDADNQE